MVRVKGELIGPHLGYKVSLSVTRSSFLNPKLVGLKVA